MSTSSKTNLIVIGAGAAGLMAARELSNRFNITVIESRNRVGGRIHSISNASGDAIIECGAEFVHGDLPITSSLVTEAKLTLVKVEGKMLRKERHELVEQNEMIDGWDNLLEKMKDCPEHFTMQDLIDKYFSSDKYLPLRKHIESFVGGFDLAHPSAISVNSLYREWVNEDEQYRLKEGYSALIDFLYRTLVDDGVEFVFGETVNDVQWSHDHVNVFTASRKKFSSTKLLITVPVSLMIDTSAKNFITFCPSIENYISSYRNIGFGSVVKVILEFSEKPWQPGVSFFFSDEKIPTWWTQYPINNNLLTGWAGGPAANRLQHHSEDELLEIALTSVSHIFDVPRTHLRNILVKSYVFNWIRSDHSIGAYSFSTPASEEARKSLKIPVSETIFFAGEGLYEGDYPGTAEAAFSSGREVSRSIARSIR